MHLRCAGPNTVKILSVGMDKVPRGPMLSADVVCFSMEVASQSLKAYIGCVNPLHPCSVMFGCVNPFHPCSVMFGCVNPIHPCSVMFTCSDCFWMPCVVSPVGCGVTVR